MNVERPHILVVDDDTRLRELLRQYLSENGYRVTVAVDSAEARGKLEGLSFDLIVLDVMMPGENGIELTDRLRRESDVPILLLSAMGETQDRIAGLESGADDYLTKPFEPRELLLRIATILRRTGTAIKPNVVRFGAFTFDPASDELSRGGKVMRLTSGELGLLRLLALNAGEPVSREELSKGTGMPGDTRAVDVQINRLRRKIETDPKTPRYLTTVWGVGYALRPD
ncbi:MAG: response regulator [Proteobacteria bacterium]|nr:response regulator [Pseudomonadota bacterium]